MALNLDDVTLPKEEIKMDNSFNFTAMLIKPNEISNFDFNKSSYLNDIFNNNHEIFEIDPINFMEIIGSKLEVNKYKKENKINTVKNNVFFQNENFLYEIFFINLDKEFHINNVNELASLINIEGDEIYGNAIILKTNIPLENFEMKFVDIKLEDLITCLESRKEPLAVILEDGEYYEQRIADIDLFALKFFNNEYFEKKELGILHHNLNIWYSKGDDYGEKLTNLINIKIDKAIFFSYQYQNYRCDLSLDEVKKLIKMAEKNIFKVNEEIIKEEKDNLGRVINKNKFRILNMHYNNI
jgi:hypothetical protein